MCPLLHRVRDQPEVLAQHGNQDHQHRAWNVYQLFKQSPHNEERAYHQQAAAHQVKIGRLHMLRASEQVILTFATG